MGSYLSQQNNSQCVTPERAQKAKGEFGLCDPRSPSQNVDRTPLKVEEVRVLNDPRSPLAENNRTPIAVKNGQKNSKNNQEPASTKKNPSRDDLRRHVLHKQGSQSKREETEKINLNEKFDEEDDDDEEEESDDVTQESENDQPVGENQEPIDENVLNLLSDLDLKSKETEKEIEKEPPAISN